MPVKKSEVNPTMQIVQLKQGSLLACIIGSSPMIFNAVSEKARRELLLPAGRKNAAALRENQKHDPFQEFQSSVYRDLRDTAPTRLVFPAAAFKRALSTAALDIPGATKSAVGRLSWVVGDKIAIYGRPELLMSVVRSADMNRTPDIRTRAILPKWACVIRINYVEPQLNQDNVERLLAAAGILCGIGDFRQEKGAGSYGQFGVTEQNDPEFVDIITNGGREAQDAALANPVAYDADTLSLYEWACAELVNRRALKVSKETLEGEAEAEDLVAELMANKAADKPRRGRPRKTLLDKQGAKGHTTNGHATA